MIDPTAASTLFAWLDREIWLVAAQADSRRGGLIATFVNQASIVPDMPRMLVGLSRQHYTWELIEESNAFSLHLLGEQHLDWVWRFGLARLPGRESPGCWGSDRLSRRSRARRRHQLRSAVDVPAIVAAGPVGPIGRIETPTPTR